MNTNRSTSAGNLRHDGKSWRRNAFYFGIGAITIGAAWFVYGLMFPRTLADDAEAIAQAVWSQNGRALQPYIYESERKALGITPEKADAIVSQLIAPRLKQCKDFQIKNKHVNLARQVPSQGICECSYRFADGRQGAFSAVANATYSGGRASLTGLLIQSWFIDYHNKHPEKPFDPITAAEASLEGYEHDAYVLKQYGIVGCFSPNSKDVLISWDEFEQRRRDNINEFTQDMPANDSGPPKSAGSRSL